MTMINSNKIDLEPVKNPDKANIKLNIFCFGREKSVN